MFCFSVLRDPTHSLVRQYVSNGSVTFVDTLFSDLLLPEIMSGSFFRLHKTWATPSAVVFEVIIKRSFATNRVSTNVAKSYRRVKEMILTNLIRFSSSCFRVRPVVIGTTRSDFSLFGAILETGSLAGETTFFGETLFLFKSDDSVTFASDRPSSLILLKIFLNFLFSIGRP